MDDTGFIDHLTVTAPTLEAGALTNTFDATDECSP